MTTGAQMLVVDEPFQLESGALLPRLELQYETVGRLNERRDNAVLICPHFTADSHAVSANGGPPGWWDGLVGRGRAIDPDRHFVVCASLLGSCYGSTGPLSSPPGQERAYGVDFPAITCRDLVNAEKLLLERLGVGRLQLVIGGSLGGMQVWQWMVDHPHLVSTGVPVAAAPQTSPWVIALNAVGRQAIYNDPAWEDGDYQGAGPTAGLALARMIGMISYRAEPQFRDRFGRSDTGRQSVWNADGGYQVESYLRYQGQKLVDRFDARSYVLLARAMDHHDVGRGWGCLEQALKRIRSRVLAVGLDHDVLFPAPEIKTSAAQLASLGKDVEYGEISSLSGHDAFLIELDQLDDLLSGFLERGREITCAS